MDTNTVINNMGLFEGLSEDGVAKLARVAVPLKMGKGRAIFEEGQPAKGFYAIGAGRVKIYKTSPSGREQILHLMGAGEVFAEVALFSRSGIPCFGPCHGRLGTAVLSQKHIRQAPGR